MKLKHFLLIPLLCLSFISKAQLTADFPDSNYYWNEYHAYYYEDLNYIVSDEGVIYDNGDSIFQGKTYRKLFYKVLFRNDWYPPQYKYRKDTILIGLIRNDKLNKKVFFVRFYEYKDSTENLLFDFGLNVGDRYPRNFQNSTSATPESDSVVVKIDTLLDPYGIKRAVYILDTNNMGTSPIIQGIGCIQGLLINTLYLPFEHSYDEMTCIHFGNGKSLSFFAPQIPNMDSTSCNMFQYLSVENNKSKNISISPNPVTSTFTINIPDEEATFTILNTLGQIQKTQIVGEGTIWKLDASLLENGIYFITILTDKNQYSSRFIKAN